MPEEAVYDIECAKVNLEDSLRDFLKGTSQLLESDYQDPKVFGARLMKIKREVMDLRGDLHDIEDALRKTIIHGLPEDTFDDEDTCESILAGAEPS